MNEDKELDAADDIEASGYFNLAVLNNGVTARVCEASQAGTSPSAPRTNLLAISNVFGWAVVGTSSGFSLFSLAQLRETYRSAKQRTEATPTAHRTISAGGDGGLSFLRIGFADKLVIAAGPALQGGVGVWRLKSLVDGSSTAPLHVFPASSSAPLLDVLPNPADRPELLALLHADGQITMINMEDKTTLGRFGSNLTAACWSVRGKQIVCGDAQGNLTQFTPEGSAKIVTAAPPSLRERSMDVIDIRWVENAVFFVTYLDRENPMDVSPFILTRAKDGSTTYNPFYDPLMVENPDRPEARFNVWMKNWSPLKHLLLVANATSNTIGHIGQGPVEEGSENIVWSQVKNDLYTTLPLETFLLGIELDLTAAEAPAAEESAGEVATPILWALATDGTLSAWRVLNSHGGQYSGISAAKDVTVDEDAGAPANSAPAGEPAAPPANAGLSASPFATGNNSTPPAFGKPAFGTGKSFSGSPVAFGGASSLGKSTFAPGFGQASFGASASPVSAAPAFGQSATFGAGGKAGFSGFGTPAATPAPVTAGAGAGFAGFSAKPASFAAAASPSAQPSSGASSPFSSAEPSRSATPAFALSTPATFGSSTFGQPAGSAPSPFGSASNSTPFGTTSAAGKPAFASTSSFGSTTFGASSTPAAFGTPSDASKPSGFGAFGGSSTSSGFGAFGSKASPTSSFSFASNTASNDNVKSPFGQPANTPAFGSLRDSAASASNQQAAPAAKPAGLDDSEVDQLEPESVADQQGGALDFGSGSKTTRSSADVPLRMDGFGFGSKESAASGSNSKALASPSLFGSFGKVADNVKKIEERQKSPEPASKTLPPSSSPFAAKPPTSGFGAFGQAASSASASPFAPKAAGDASADNKAADKPAFSFANVVKPSGQDSTTASNADTTSKPASGFGSTGFGAASAFGATAFGKPSAFGKAAEVKTEGKDQAKPSGFSGFSAFGQPSPLGGAESKSPFSFASSAVANKSAEDASSSPNASKPSGFAGFASPSAGQTSSSPFGSPSASPSATKTSAFGQPGFFSKFGQKPKDAGKDQTKGDPQVKKEEDEEPETVGQKDTPVDAKPADVVVAKPMSEADTREVSSADDESQQEGDEWEQVQGESQEDDGAEDEQGNAGEEDDGDEDEDEGEDEEEEDYDEEEEEEENDDEAEEERSGEGEVEETEANGTGAESAHDEEDDLTPASERSQGEDQPSPSSPPSPTPVAPPKPASKPSAEIAKSSEKPALSFGAPAKTESSQQSAWSFGALASKTADASAAAQSGGATEQAASKAPAFSFAKPQAESTKVAAASPFAPKETAEKAPAPPTFGFGQSQQASSAASTAKVSEPSKPPNAFSFSSGPAAPTGKPAEPPKPFGFSHLNKAAPRTSSPLAAMPSFQPASPQTSQIGRAHV